MKRILCPLLVSALPFGGAFAQTAPQPVVVPVMQKDLADMPGKEMVMLTVDYPPGAVEQSTGTTPTPSSTCSKGRSSSRSGAARRSR
jgi:hypothetical protein